MKRARRRAAMAIVLVAVAYFIAGKLGLRAAFVNASASAVWPPTGIALAACLLLGYKVWPAIFLGAFLVNVTTAGTIATSLGIALGNTLESLVGAYLVNRFANGRRAFEQVEGVLKFTVLAAILSTTVSATIGVTSLWLGRLVSWETHRAVWFTWWLGDMGGALIVTPFLVLWNTRARVPWTVRKMLEWAVLLLALALLFQAVFGGWPLPAVRMYPLTFLCLPMLVWVAFRFSQREAAMAVVVLSGFAIWGTLHGFGPLVLVTPNESLLVLQAFLDVVAVTILVLATVVSQHRRAEELFHVAVESAPNAMMIVNQRGRILLVNSQTEQVFGYTRLELIGQPIELLVPERFRVRHPEYRDGFFAAPRTRLMGMGRDLYGLRKDGREFPVEIGLNPIHTDQGMHVLAAVVDITERKRTEEVLRRAHEELERQVAERTASLMRTNEELQAVHLQVVQAAKMESIGRLAAGVAHEVKNPLAVILQGLDFLSKRVPNDGQTAVVLKHTIGAVTRADAIIRDLLDFSSPRELALHRCDFHLIIEHAVGFVKYELERAHVAVVQQSGAPLPQVAVDAQKMEQVFVNLFMNAIHAMPDGGSLTIRTSTRQLSSADENVGTRKEDRFKIGETVVIADVEDTGTGIPAHLVQKIFEPFFTTKAGGKGTGLGLAVTQKIVELHGGTITVANRAEGGARVTVMLRAALDDLG